MDHKKIMSVIIEAYDEKKTIATAKSGGGSVPFLGCSDTTGPGGLDHVTGTISYMTKKAVLEQIGFLSSTLSNNYISVFVNFIKQFTKVFINLC